ncbi:hypothetical protein [Okeania sp. SIO3I5]|nr:hypothetical protein [Okeania sp. SIO3I5]
MAKSVSCFFLLLSDRHFQLSVVSAIAFYSGFHQKRVKTPS